MYYIKIINMEDIIMFLELLVESLKGIILFFIIKYAVKSAIEDTK